MGPGTAAGRVAVKVGFPTLVRIKAPPLVGKERPELKNKELVEVIGPIAVVRSYVANALLLSPKIINPLSLKSTREAKVVERTAIVCPPYFC
jgi:hypothetical protein